jgi:Arc/MetJ-type ribon-helix-helix transcriptional regulator
MIILMKRVTVTLPEELVSEIDRWERNRSRFVMVAAERELEARRRQALERSLANPHAESFRVAEAGIEDWDAGWTADDEGLVDGDRGRPVRWQPDRGWIEGDE